MIVDASAYEGAQRSFHRDTNGPWKAILPEAELAQYDDALEPGTYGRMSTVTRTGRIRNLIRTNHAHENPLSH